MILVQCPVVAAGAVLMMYFMHQALMETMNIDAQLHQLCCGRYKVIRLLCMCQMMQVHEVHHTSHTVANTTLGVITIHLHQLMVIILKGKSVLILMKNTKLGCMLIQKILGAVLNMRMFVLVGIIGEAVGEVKSNVSIRATNF